ncbi:MAG: hypothetical protein [Circular genetic element sp.]|nr:MAG: hypothetical protein [Circular genetic element sp.]
MARKYSGKKRSNKIEPSAMTLYIPTTPVGGPTPATVSYIDLSQIASLMNRRFYRQGINWAVAGIKVLNVTGFIGSITVSKLPNTWVMSNAWEKGMRAWLRMNNEALDESPSVRPRFLDFKIFADHEHAVAGYAANLMPVSLGSTAAPNPVATPGEWSSARAVIPVAAGAVEGAVNEFEFIATGGSFQGPGASGLNSISLIEGYANSRGLPYPEDPNVPDDAADADDNTPENWLAAMFNEGAAQTDEVLDIMITDNNQAPYPFENDGVNVDTMYPGGQNQLTGLEIHSTEFITPTTVGGTTRIKGGNFPCGLMRLDITNQGEVPNNLVLEIDLVPGSHRGYLCESMTEM